MPLKVKTQVFIVMVVVICTFLGCYKLVRMIAPGSYPFAEEYVLNYAESEVKAAINQLKQEDHSLLVPDVTINDTIVTALSDHQNDHWYTFYFYLKDRKSIVLTYTRSALEGKKTIFAFVGINEGLELGNWRNINDDFGFFENRRLKKESEERILNRIKQKLEARNQK